MLCVNPSGEAPRVSLFYQGCYPNEGQAYDLPYTDDKACQEACKQQKSTYFSINVSQSYFLFSLSHRQLLNEY